MNATSVKSSISQWYSTFCHFIWRSLLIQQLSCLTDTCVKWGIVGRPPHFFLSFSFWANVTQLPVKMKRQQREREKETNIDRKKVKIDWESTQWGTLSSSGQQVETYYVIGDTVLTQDLYLIPSCHCNTSSSSQCNPFLFLFNETGGLCGEVKCSEREDWRSTSSTLTDKENKMEAVIIHHFTSIFSKNAIH